MLLLSVTLYSLVPVINLLLLFFFFYVHSKFYSYSRARQTRLGLFGLGEDMRLTNNTLVLIKLPSLLPLFFLYI